MKRKFICAVTAAVCAVSLAGCTADSVKPPTEPTLREPVLRESETFIVTAVSDTDRQLEVIADNLNMWYIPDALERGYCVTDLDQNGRLEIIASEIQGSGRYSTSNIYEVNANLDGLEQAAWEKTEGDSEPDLLNLRSCEVFYDSETYHYIVSDYVSDVSEVVSSFALKDAGVEVKLLALADRSGGTFYGEDKSGREITEEEFESIAENSFPEEAKGKAELSWIQFSPEGVSDINTLSRENLLSQLKGSYAGFSIRI